VRVGETVRLVPQAHEQELRLRILGEDEGVRIPRDEHLLLAFGESNHGELEIEFLEHGERGRELPLAAVDHQEVGLGGE